MALTIICDHGYLYCYREPTESDANRYLSAGYRVPTLVNERDPSVYQYARGNVPPRYPMPALQTDTLYWRLPQLGQRWLDTRVTVMHLIAAWQLWMQGYRH